MTFWHPRRGGRGNVTVRNVTELSKIYEISFIDWELQVTLLFVLQQGRHCNILIKI